MASMAFIHWMVYFSMCLIRSIFINRPPKDTPVSEIHQLEQKFRQNVKELNMYCHLHSTNMIFEEIHFMLKTNTCRSTGQFAQESFNMIKHGYDHMEILPLSGFYCGLIHKDKYLVKYMMENIITEKTMKIAKSNEWRCRFWPPLQIAVGKKDLNLISYFMNHSADPIEKNCEGQDALDMAIVKKDLKTFEMLAGKISIDINHKEDYGERYIDKAAYFGQVDIVKYILNQTKFNLSEDKIIGAKLLTTPITAAGQTGHLEVIKVLLDFLKAKNPNSKSRSYFLFYSYQEEMLIYEKHEIDTSNFHQKVKQYLVKHYYEEFFGPAVVSCHPSFEFLFIMTDCSMIIYLVKPVLQYLWQNIANHHENSFILKSISFGCNFIDIFYGLICFACSLSPAASPFWTNFALMMSYVGMLWKFWFCLNVIFVLIDQCLRKIKKKLYPLIYHNHLKSSHIRYFLKPILYFAEILDGITIRFRAVPQIIGENLVHQYGDWQIPCFA